MTAALNLARAVLDDTRTWGKDAACIGKASILENPNETAARTLCAHCPVLDDCARWVLHLTRRQDPGGFIAGMNEANRNAVRREIVKAKRRKQATTRKPPAKAKPSAKPAAPVAPAPAKPPAEVLPAGKKRCSKCTHVKDVTEFYVELRARDGIAGVCITCKRAANRASARKRRGEKRAAAERRRADTAYNTQTRTPRKKAAA